MEKQANIQGVRFICASSRAELDERVLDILEARVDGTGSPRFLYLSPTRRKNREMAAGLRTRRLSWRPRLFVPMELALRIVQARPERIRTWVSPELKTLLVLKVLEEASADGSLNALRFRGSRTPVGVARHVAHALENLGRRGLSPLRVEAGLRPSLAADLNHVHERYRALLDSHGLTDLDDLPGLAIEALMNREVDILDGIDSVILDGFVAPEKAEADFIVELARSFGGKEVLVTLPQEVIEALQGNRWADLPPHVRLFAHGEGFLRRLGLTEQALAKPHSKPGHASADIKPCLEIDPTQTPSPCPLPSREGRKFPSPPSGEGRERGWPTQEPDLNSSFSGRPDESRPMPANNPDAMDLHRRAPSSDSSLTGPVRHPKMSLHCYLDRVAEVRGIARAIKQLFFNQKSGDNFKPEDFHVVVPRIDPYYRLFIEFFPRYGIPFNITRGIPLSSIPVVGLVSSLLDAVILRDHAALVKFFSSDLVTIAPPASLDGLGSFVAAHSTDANYVSEGPFSRDVAENGTLTLDILVLDRACREAGVKGGRNLIHDWLQPIVRHSERQIMEARAEDDPDAESRAGSNLQTVLVHLWLLGKEFEVFDRVEGRRPPEQLVSDVNGLVNRYDLNRNLVRSLTALEPVIDPGGRIIFEKNVRGFSRGLEVISEIGRDLNLAGETTKSIDAIRDIFRDRCRNEMIQEAGELAGVSVSQMLEMRNISRRVVFVAGLTADDFPVAPTPNFVLPQGPDSELFRRAVDESRFIFAQTVRNSGELLLSYPTADGDEPLEPSPFLEDLVHGGELKEPSEDPEHEEPFCGYEILQSAGRSWLEGAPVPWDTIGELIARYPVPPDTEVEVFHADLRRALLAGLLRSRTDQYGPYDGMIQDESTLRVIAGILNDRSFFYSISMLNDYRRCPLQFFFKRILGVEPIKAIPEEPDVAEIGTVVHDILARFYGVWSREAPGRIRSDNRVAALATLHRIAKETLETHSFLSRDLMESWAVRGKITSGLYDERQLGDSSLRDHVEMGTDLPQHKRGPLRILVDGEAALDLPLYPWAMEFAFGFDDKPPLVLPGHSGHLIRIRGKIDRIDLFKTDHGGSSHVVWVFDYKTGRYPSMKDVRNGMDLQLPVYLLAALECLPELHVTEAGACFLSLRLMEKNPRKNLIVTSGMPAEALPKAGGKPWILSPDDLTGFKENILSIDNSIRRGEFPRTPHISQCRRCDFVAACFRDEHRVRLLSESPVVADDSNLGSNT